MDSRINVSIRPYKVPLTDRKEILLLYSVYCTRSVTAIHFRTFCLSVMGASGSGEGPDICPGLGLFERYQN
jgi:hypothetical protein